MDADRLGITGRSGRKLVLKENSRKLLADDVLVWFNGPATRHRRYWSLPVVDAMRTAAPLLSPARFLPPGRERLVLVDAGHGGADKGAIGIAGTREKDLTLLLATRVHTALRMAGVNCELTRAADVALSLDQRVAMARRRKASVFVSIHLNSATNPESSGVETFVISAAGYPSTAAGSRSMGFQPGNAHDASNLLLGYAVQSAILKRTGQVDRGVKRARFKVIREAPCTAVLVECGFLSNRHEAAALQTRDLQSKLVDGIASAILSYVTTPARP